MSSYSWHTSNSVIPGGSRVVRTVRTVPIGTRTVTRTIQSGAPISTRTVRTISSRPTISARQPASTHIVRTVRTGAPFASNLAERQSNWESEIDVFRKDFYRDTPFGESVIREPQLKLFPDSNSAFTTKTESTEKTEEPKPEPKKFSVEFPLIGYEPDEIEVKVEGSQLTVKATQKDSSGNMLKSSSKTVGIPSDVDPDKLVSTMDDLGILTVALPVPPTYDTIKSESSDLADQTSSLTISDSTPQDGSV